MRSDRKMTLAVTGGIGSGKSLVCSMFRDRGIPVYDSDSRTKGLYDSVPGLAEEISRAVGQDVISADGRLDRSRLSSVVFSDPDRLKALEAVVHPYVRQDFLQWRDSFSGTDPGFVIIESAIILEKPLFRDLADKTLLVDAPLQLRISRAAARDHTDDSHIKDRMRSQKLLNDISEGKTGAGTDYVIINDGSVADLELKVDKIYDDILKK